MPVRRIASMETSGKRDVNQPSSAEGPDAKDQWPGVADSVAKPPDELVLCRPEEPAPPWIAQRVVAESPARTQFAVRDVLVDGTLMPELDHFDSDRSKAGILERGKHVGRRREVALRRGDEIDGTLDRALSQRAVEEFLPGRGIRIRRRSPACGGKRTRSGQNA